MTARSASLPGTSDPIRSSIPRTRAPPSVASSSASAAVERIGPPLTGARADDRRSDLLEEIERRRRRRAVRRDRNGHAGVAKLPQRRDATAEIAVRAWTVRDADPVLCQEADLLGIGVHAMSGHQPWPEQSLCRQHADPRLAGRRHEKLGERAPVPGPVDQPVALGCTLGEVGRLRQAELGAGAVGLDRAGVRRMRGDAEEHAVGERALDRGRATRGTARAPARRSRRPRGRRSRAGRSPPRAIAAAPEKLQSPIVVTPERRHSCAPTVAISTMSSNASASLR